MRRENSQNNIINNQNFNPDLNIDKEKPLNLLKIYGYFSNQLDTTTYVIYVLMELAEIDWDDIR